VSEGSRNDVEATNKIKYRETAREEPVVELRRQPQR
jgi:hypothetical protein